MQDNNTKELIELKDLLYIWRMFKKNWYLFIFLPLIAGVVAYFKVYPLENIYGAKTTIELSSSEMDPQAQYYSSWGMQKDYSNEVRALQSRKLVERTLNRMKINVYQYLVGRLKTTDQYPFHFFDIEADISDPIFHNLPFNIKALNENEFELSYAFEDIKGVKDEEFTEKYFFGEMIIKNGLILKISRLRDANEVIGLNHQFVIKDKRTLVNQYLNSLTVLNEEGSSIADIEVTDVVGGRAVSFLKTLSEVYIENSLETKLHVNENTVKYINIQLDEITQVLNGIESDIERYRETKKILNLSREEEILFSKLVEIENEVRLGNVKLENLLKLESYLETEVKMDVLPPNLFIDYDDKFITETFENLFKLQNEQREILTQKTKESAYVIKNTKEIETLKINLLKYIDNNKKAIISKLNSRTAEKSKIENKLKEMPKSVRQLNNIERNLAVNEQIYLYLLQKRAETNISKAGIVSDKKIIEPAYSLGIIGPNRKKTYVTFIGAALGLAALISIIRLLAFDTIDNKEDLQIITSVSILGEIAGDDKYDEELGIAVEKHPKSHLSESFRSIRTNIEYLGKEDECKTILLTSFTSGEGKTFCSINLAATLARAQKRVLLIGLDLHKPKFTSYLNYDQNKGITSYLVGKEKLEDIIHNYSNFLDIIPSGPVPPNASEVIISQDLQKLIKAFKKEYDYIVLDTPPVGALSDAVALMKLSDINLFVMRAEVAKKYFVKNAEELKQKHNPANFMFLLNDVNFKKGKYGYYSYTDYISGNS